MMSDDWQMLRAFQIILWGRQFKWHWKFITIQHFCLAIQPSYHKPGSPNNVLKINGYNPMKEKVKVLMSKHFYLFSFQCWTAQAVSAISKKITWGQYSNLVLSYLIAVWVSSVTKDCHFFQIWNILIYGREKAVFHFKLTMHKSHKTNASQIFSWREQKSVSF